jgi:hypothetical protein
LPRAQTAPPVPSAPPAPTPPVTTAQHTAPIRPTPPDRQSRPGLRDKQESRSTPGFGTRTPPEVTSPMPAAAPAAASGDGVPAPAPMVDTGRPVQHTPAQIIGAAESGDSSGLDGLLDAGRFDEAVAAYKMLAKKHPSERHYRAGLELVEGLRALGQRDRLEAAQRFEAALEIDPSNERAARELAEMRRQATNERKGQLSRLMGKKEP